MKGSKEKYFHIIAENSGDVIWIMNLETMRFTYVSPSVLQLRGFTPEEVMEQTMDQVMTPDSYRFIMDNIPMRIQRFMEGDESLRIMTTQIRQPRKDGSFVPTEVVTTLIPDEHGKVTEILGVSRDITQRLKVEQELIESKERAQESDRLKTIFLQNMSHEIRTPMNAIIGFSELLPEAFEDKDRLKYFTTIIRQRSADLLRLIDDILQISRIEAGQIPVFMERFDLPALLDELYQFFLGHRDQVEKQAIDLQVSIVEDPQYRLIRTDKMKLKQIFINLVHNALKFTASGHIRFGCRLDGQEKLLFFVEDTGPGIPADKHDRIFERFMQLDSAMGGRREGTGLGLSIVRGLVGCLGGSIRLESEPGKGTTFFFTLPYETSKPCPPSEKKSGTFRPYDWNKHTLLIVEDEVYNTEYLRILLAPTGIQVAAAPDANKAIGLIQSGLKFDVVLMDIGLPGLDGYEATRIIKSLDPGAKIIAQTAFATPPDRRKALEAGCNDYISKPIDKLLLFSKIREQLLAI